MKLISIAVALAVAAGFNVARTSVRAGGINPAPHMNLDDGCVSCHNGIEPMHISAAVKLSCTDCHGGNGTTKDKKQAHAAPRNADIWKTTANPPRTYTALLRDSPEFVRFINPRDLRVAPEVGVGGHPSQV